MEIPKMTAVYICNEEWVKRAILHYHRDISKFDYPKEKFDVSIDLTFQERFIEKVPGDEIDTSSYEATITVIKKDDEGETLWDKFKKIFRLIFWIEERSETEATKSLKEVINLGKCTK